MHNTQDKNRQTNKEWEKHTDLNTQGQMNGKSKKGWKTDNDTQWRVKHTQKKKNISRRLNPAISFKAGLTPLDLTWMKEGCHSNSLFILISIYLDTISLYMYTDNKEIFYSLTWPVLKMLAYIFNHRADSRFTLFSDT